MASVHTSMVREEENICRRHLGENRGVKGIERKEENAKKGTNIRQGETKIQDETKRQRENKRQGETNRL